MNILYHSFLQNAQSEPCVDMDWFDRFLVANGGEYRNKTAHEFVKANPPPHGSGFFQKENDEPEDFLKGLDRIEKLAYEDCKTYVRLVRILYGQVQPTYSKSVSLEPSRGNADASDSTDATIENVHME